MAASTNFADTAGGPRRGGKSREAFRTIGEVAEELDVAQHVLRFWETKFHQVRPLKRGGGRRYYRPEDILFLRRIKRLLYTEGYTIKGVQRLIRQGGVAALEGDVAAEPETSAESRGAATALAASSRSAIERAIGELEACRRLLAGRG